MVKKQGRDGSGRRIPLAHSKDFVGIESALSHCVQSCLAMEPVLAVTISISHSLSGAEFRNAFAKVWKETQPQRTAGRVNGELNEYFMFAALQMACRAKEPFPRTLSVRGMVEQLYEYLKMEPDVLASDIVSEVIEIWNGDVDLSDEYPEQELGLLTDFHCHEGQDISEIQTLFENTKMPWLVPACSPEKLREKILETRDGSATTETQQHLFSGMHIAGLVPAGSNNAIMDATAYRWAPDAPLEWAFEFRGRSGSYSMKDAWKDLGTKCENMNSAECHALLVGLTGSKKSQCRVAAQGGKLRIVLLVGIESLFD